MKCVNIDMNIPDIMHIVQFKISDFITLPDLLWWLGQERRNKFYTIIAIVFIYSSQILLDNMHMLKYSTFKSL